MNPVHVAIANYAVKFQVDAPDVEPTDEALRKVLQHCALPPRPEWLPVIRALLVPREGAIADEDLAFLYVHAKDYARGDVEYGHWYVDTYGRFADSLADVPDHTNAWLRYQEWRDTQEDADPDDLS
jgi:hypothetical protein